MSLQYFALDNKINKKPKATKKTESDKKQSFREKGIYMQ